MLLRIKHENGSSFTVYVKRELVPQVSEDYQFMGYSGNPA